MFLWSLYQQKLSKLLSKNFKRSIYWNNIKQKVRIKMQQMNIDIFSNQTLLESIGYLFYFIQMKMTKLKDLKLEDIIYQKKLILI